MQIFDVAISVFIPAARLYRFGICSVHAIMSDTTMQDVTLIHDIFTVIIVVFSVVAHEISHGYMAQFLGDPTARLAGRLSVNPLKHVDPVGSLLVPFVMSLAPGGFILGWAKPVPYNPYNLRDQKWGDSKVALAGPLTNLGIAVFFSILVRVFGTFFTDPVQQIIYLIIGINIVLAIFNLVPIPPLDGSKVLLNSLPLRYRYIGDYLERYSLFIILFFIVFLWRFLVPLAAVVSKLLIGFSLFS